MYKHILVAIDPMHGEVGDRIIKVAKYLAGDSGTVTLVTVLDPVPSFAAHYVPRETLDETHAEAREQIQAMATAAGVGAQVLVRHGAPATAILEDAEELGCDAIILGSHRPDYRDYLMGSTAARVVRHAQCTVIVERSEVVSA